MNKIYIIKDISIIDDKAVHTGFYAKHDDKSTRYFGWTGGIIGRGNQPKIWKTLNGAKKSLTNKYPDCKVIVKNY